MIYRLSTGAQSDWRKRITSMSLVLAVTVGFPAFAAWLNYDHYTRQPAAVAQNDSTGSVLGETTETATPPAPTPDPEPMAVTPTPAPRSIKVNRPAATLAPAPKAPAAPSAPAPVTPTPEPAATADPGTTEPTVPETGGGLEVEIPPIIDLDVDVLPSDPL